MKSADLARLPEAGAYLFARFSDGKPETVRFLRVAEPTEKELMYGHVSNRVHVRRFLGGGWVDTWVYPRDVLSVAEPDAALLRVIDFIEREVGEKPEHRPWASAADD